MTSLTLGTVIDAELAFRRRLFFGDQPDDPELVARHVTHKINELASAAKTLGLKDLTEPELRRLGQRLASAAAVRLCGDILVAAQVAGQKVLDKKPPRDINSAFAAVTSRNADDLEQRFHAIETLILGLPGHPDLPIGNRSIEAEILIGFREHSDAISKTTNLLYENATQLARFFERAPISQLASRSKRDRWTANLRSAAKRLTDELGITVETESDYQADVRLSRALEHMRALTNLPVAVAARAALSPAAKEAPSPQDVILLSPKQLEMLGSRLQSTPAGPRATTPTVTLQNSLATETSAVIRLLVGFSKDQSDYGRFRSHGWDGDYVAVKLAAHINDSQFRSALTTFGQTVTPHDWQQMVREATDSHTAFMSRDDERNFGAQRTLDRTHARLTREATAPRIAPLPGAPSPVHLVKSNLDLDFVDAVNDLEIEAATLSEHLGDPASSPQKRSFQAQEAMQACARAIWILNTIAKRNRSAKATIDQLSPTELQHIGANLARELIRPLSDAHTHLGSPDSYSGLGQLLDTSLRNIMTNGYEKVVDEAIEQVGYYADLRAEVAGLLHATNGAVDGLQPGVIEAQLPGSIGKPLSQGYQRMREQLLAPASKFFVEAKQLQFELEHFKRLPGEDSLKQIRKQHKQVVEAATSLAGCTHGVPNLDYAIQNINETITSLQTLKTRLPGALLRLEAINQTLRANLDAGATGNELGNTSVEWIKDLQSTNLASRLNGARKYEERLFGVADRNLGKHAYGELVEAAPKIMEAWGRQHDPTDTYLKLRCEDTKHQTLLAETFAENWYRFDGVPQRALNLFQALATDRAVTRSIESAASNTMAL